MKTTEHDPGCTRPGWIVQQRVIRKGPLIAVCQGCGAVRKVNSITKGTK